MSNQQNQPRGAKEYVVLIPLQKTAILNIVLIERRRVGDITDKNILHIGSGRNVDFIIYKNSLPVESDNEPSQFSSQFKVFMMDKRTQELNQENRILRFWFHSLEQNQCLYDANELIHALFKSDEFPRDYFSFIKRLMELLRMFTRIRKIELEIQTLDKNALDVDHPMYEKNPERYADLIKEKLLDLLEQAFPNPMFVNDLAKYVECDGQTVFEYLVELEDKNLVKHLDPSGQQWTRVIIAAQEEETHKVIIYKSISELSSAFHPTIAIITVNYFEKLAVDSMIENKVTFVRHKAGESNVYTIGTIGPHHVVSTKLPLIGRSRTAQISTGSTTTRLLGTFQQVQHVFIIGCAGGVPHYTDATKHVRRGDIIVGYPNEEDYVYGIYEAEQSAEGYEFVSTCYKPKSFQLYQLMEPIKENYEQTHLNRLVTHKYPWETFLEEGLQYLLSNNIDCLPPNSDRLYIKMENSEIVEVKHPDPAKKDYHRPNIRFGMIAGGKNIITNDYLKTTLCDKCNVLCFDSEIDQVIAAVQGNRTESFMIIRGISDYHDGTLNKEWQPFSALCAAAFMKTIIYKIPKPSRQNPNSHSNSEHDDDVL
ncbi:unnamed protein product [Rotaria magnacalcarata]|uniref:Winged helix-turn-helix domain-containing protein n=1 Tax=Rotaria magnacalcarata TaxID=392030 RepID=A0A816KSF4_9BILA|nr:unnamed protein product [Rotaria magnacalcarata]CAF1223065.1 unnamed protein product [Rotaria magnacalcarata]CAF1922303.1 unnamed protein product [Rotaria magnacalcarata]CAF1935162.1 unnamed protein product [Rotaria magnacalcarata]CAF1969912.1 unnamed protein product [Rotaria magnacalcarata]